MLHNLSGSGRLVGYPEITLGSIAIPGGNALAPLASQEIANAFFPVDPDWSRKDFVDETCERNAREILD